MNRFKTKKRMWKAAALITSAALISPWLPVSGKVSAYGVYSYADEKGAVQDKGAGTKISGDHMVWYQGDSKGNKQIYYMNLATKEKKQITSVPSPKGDPVVTVMESGEVVVIWADKRSYGVNDAAWDMYSFSLTTEKEKKINSVAGQYVDLSADGPYVVWTNNGTNEMFLYDLKQENETKIGLGKRPVVADGKIVYKQSQSGGLDEYMIASGSVRNILTLPYHLYVARFAYNGKQVVWKEEDLDSKTKYVLLDTSDAALTPKDLSSYSKKLVEYPTIVIGDQWAAWPEYKDGALRLMGLNLPHAETFQQSQGDDAKRAVAFSGDRLVYLGADGTVTYRSFTRQEVTPSDGSGVPVNGGGGSTTETGTGTGKLEEKEDPYLASGIIGSYGGEVQAGKGEVRLRIPSGIFLKDTKVEIKLNLDIQDKINATPSDAKRKAGSKAWDINLGNGFKGSAKLTFTYDTVKWSAHELPKLAVYRWDATGKAWRFAGGKLDADKHTLEADIAESGTYAVWMNDVTFADVTDKHWAKSAIESLAVRGIVNGVTDVKFAPNAVLTRAQFTKMLLGAMGINPTGEAGTSPFTDVSPSHWSTVWVEAAAKAGIVKGEAGKFRPDAEVTREQMTVMLIRAMGLEQQALELETAAVSKGLAFKDQASISAYAKAYVALSSQYKLIQGEQGAFNAKKSSTRAEAATVIYRLLKHLNKV